MTVATITHTSWDFTCKVCNVIRNAIILVVMGMISLAESTGRARAASELANRGLYEEARYLMMYKKED